MREILFRGKSVGDGEWIEGNLFIPDRDDTPTEICIGTNIVRISYDVQPETIGQYTGLTDKNGKKIFEGDIFEDDDCRGVVIFENGAFKIKWYGVTTVLYEYGYDDGDWGELDTESFDMFYADKMEIIGNIHDNPELLGGEQ